MKRIRAKLAALLVAAVPWAGAVAATDFECVIQPSRVLDIRSPIDGLVQRVVVDRGQTVRKDQELAFLDSTVERVALESARFRSKMDGASKAGQSKVQLSSRRLDRAQELTRREFVSRQTQDDAQTEKELAEAELQEAKDNRKLAEIEYRRQQKLIDLKTIRSPINGVVIERILNVGELAESGVGRKPILRLAEVETLHVEALLPSELYRQIKIGNIGIVTPALPGARQERAAVKTIDKVLDAGSGTFGVRLELPNKDGHLPAGLRCSVSFAGIETTATPARTPEPIRNVGPSPRPAVVPAAPAPVRK